MKIQHIPLADLKPNAENPNQMTQKQRDQLYNSLKQYGFLQPLVITHDHIILNGNQKYLVLSMHEDLQEAHPTIPCHIIPKDTSKEDQQLIIQALNKIHGQHDLTKDSAIFERLIQQERGADLATLLGKKPDTISKLIQRTKDAADGITSHDTTTGKCKEGETWALGRHILYVGDCNQYHAEAQKEQIALMLTDPPYGIDVVGDDGSVGSRHGKPQQYGTCMDVKHTPITGDNKPFDPAPLLDIKTDTTIIFGANYMQLPTGTRWLVWVKRQPDQFHKLDMSDCELAWTNRKGVIVHAYHHVWAGVFRAGKKALNERVHPTQKPVELLRDMIQDYSKEGDLIYDPYLGSGSTLMACEISNRTCIGVELSPEYCELVINRWESHTKQKAEKVKST